MNKTKFIGSFVNFFENLWKENKFASSNLKQKIAQAINTMNTAESKFTAIVVVI